ncbi:hypothetical protein LBW94_026295 [Nocardia sp. alder85J]|nr:hypothetical protein [Nocardia sp. alder85J]
MDRSVRDIVDGPLETLGRAILKRLVEDVPDDTRKLYRALFGALDRPEVRAYLETSTARQVTAPLIERLPGPDAAVRAELITVQIAGLLMNGRILGSGAGRRPDPHVLDIYARAIQALIDTPET